MSTKIYYAWRLKDRNANRFFKWIQEYKLTNTKRIRNDVIYLLNKVDFEKFKAEKNIDRGREAWDVFVSEHDKEKRSRMWPYDKSVQMSFVFKDGYLYFLLFGDDTEMHSLRKEIAKHKYISEYGYWNNTDQPDNVTDEQWDERREFWDWVCELSLNDSFSGMMNLEIFPDFVHQQYELPMWFIWGRNQKQSKATTLKNFPDQKFEDSFHYRECKRFGLTP